MPRQAPSRWPVFGGRALASACEQVVPTRAAFADAFCMSWLAKASRPSKKSSARSKPAGFGLRQRPGRSSFCSTTPLGWPSDVKVWTMSCAERTSWRSRGNPIRSRCWSSDRGTTHRYGSRSAPLTSRGCGGIRATKRRAWGQCGPVIPCRWDVELAGPARAERRVDCV